MRNLFFAVVVVLSLAVAALAQDAEVGKEYDIVIASEMENQYVGAFGQAKIGSVVFDIPNARKDQKYHVHVTDIKKNQYTGDTQASCDFQQTGGSAKGMCIAAP